MTTDKEILALLQSPNQEDQILGCRILGEKEIPEIIKFFGNNLHFQIMNENISHSFYVKISENKHFGFYKYLGYIQFYDNFQCTDYEIIDFS